MKPGGSPPKIERTARKAYRTRNQALADVFDDIELFCNPQRRHSTIGYVRPIEFEWMATSARDGRLYREGEGSKEIGDVHRCLERREMTDAGQQVQFGLRNA